jgi:6-pyruvoyltetrahydropterin/6-carboxytetrahydropterin synthase
MFKVRTKFHFAAAHNLDLNYPSPCSNMHGHNYEVELELEATKLNQNGMVLDFALIKKLFRGFDHSYLNDRISQPTAEMIAHYIAITLQDYCKEQLTNTPLINWVEVSESSGNLARWER